MSFRHLTAFDGGSFHALDDGKDCGAEFQIVESAVAVREECPDIAIHDTEHPAFRCLLEPVVDVLIQESRGFRLHPLVIFERDAEPRRNLLVSEGIHAELQQLLSRGEGEP